MRSYLATPGATREVMQRWGMHTKKALGQHFLVDGHVIERIGQLCDVGPHDTVLEVGPGIGTLTVGLLDAGAQVLAVERDAQLAGVLADDCRAVCRPEDRRLVLLQMDALELGQSHIEDAQMRFARPEPLNKMVSNLPYAVAATIVLGVLQGIPSIDSLTVMVQHEVAMRMCARPGAKDYGAYTVKLALFAQAGASFAVAPQCFFPPPRVDSRVIRLDRCPAHPDAGVLDAACLAADAAFHQRRKTIRNSMRAYFALRGLDQDLADQALQAAGIDAQSRGEAHGPDAYLAMGRFLAAVGAHAR